MESLLTWKSLQKNLNMGVLTDFDIYQQYAPFLLSKAAIENYLFSNMAGRTKLSKYKNSQARNIVTTTVVDYKDTEPLDLSRGSKNVTDQTGNLNIVSKEVSRSCSTDAPLDLSLATAASSHGKSDILFTDGNKRTKNRRGFLKELGLRPVSLPSAKSGSCNDQIPGMCF